MILNCKTLFGFHGLYKNISGLKVDTIVIDLTLEALIFF